MNQRPAGISFFQICKKLWVDFLTESSLSNTVHLNRNLQRGRIDPQKLMQERFDRFEPEDLNIREASDLLDVLKQEYSVASRWPE